MSANVLGAKREPKPVLSVVGEEKIERYREYLTDEQDLTTIDSLIWLEPNATRSGTQIGVCRLYPNRGPTHRSRTPRRARGTPGGAFVSLRTPRPARVGPDRRPRGRRSGGVLAGLVSPRRSLPS